MQKQQRIDFSKFCGRDEYEWMPLWLALFVLSAPISGVIGTGLKSNLLFTCKHDESQYL